MIGYNINLHIRSFFDKTKCNVISGFYCIRLSSPQERRGFLIHSEIVKIGEHPLITALARYLKISTLSFFAVSPSSFCKLMSELSQLSRPLLRGKMPKPWKFYEAYCAAIFSNESFIDEVR